jgi:hypothetical protein
MQQVGVETILARHTRDRMTRLITGFEYPGFELGGIASTTLGGRNDWC